MSTYILEDEREGLRLEKQNARKIYSVEDELAGVELVPNATILDAGCGTGAITRYLLEHHSIARITAMDFSELRLSQNKKLSLPISGSTKLEFKCGDLNHTGLEEKTFDAIISRFVMHHLSDPAGAIKHLASLLKVNGKMVVIDSDGILFNTYSSNMWLQSALDKIRAGLTIDMFVGRKLKSYFHQAGLTQVESKIIPMHFINEELSFELEQYRERFSMMKGVLEEHPSELQSR